MSPLRITSLAAVVGTGAIGGVFFAFSTFVMQGLGRLPAPDGIAAMQRINETAVRPAFMTALFGTAAVCVGLGLHAPRHRDQTGARLLLAGSALPGRHHRSHDRVPRAGQRRPRRARP